MSHKKRSPKKTELKEIVHKIENIVIENKLKDVDIIHESANDKRLRLKEIKQNLNKIEVVELEEKEKELHRKFSIIEKMKEIGYREYYKSIYKSKAVIIIISLSILTGFTTVVNKSNATVDQKEGMNIFIYSKPTNEYEYLGSITKSFALTGQPEEMLNSMIEKVKKKYPNADGIIFTSSDMGKVDAIKFK